MKILDTTRLASVVALGGLMPAGAASILTRDGFEQNLGSWADSAAPIF